MHRNMRIGGSIAETEMAASKDMQIQDLSRIEDHWNWINSVVLDLLYWTVDRLIQTIIAALKHSQMSSPSRTGNHWSWTSSIPSGSMSRAVDSSIPVVDCSISLITMKTGLQSKEQAFKRRNRPLKEGTGLRRN